MYVKLPIVQRMKNQMEDWERNDVETGKLCGEILGLRASYLKLYLYPTHEAPDSPVG